MLLEKPSREISGTLPLLPLVLLFAGAVLTIAPHAIWLPWWVDAVAGGLLLWRVWVALRGGALPPRWLLALVTVVSGVGVYFSYRSLMGRDPGVTLIVLLLSLKLMETRTSRDVFIVAFLVYFVALSAFFYSQSMQTAAWMLVTVLITTGALVGFSAPSRPVADNLTTAGRMLIQAGPVMLLLFFLFPRVQGPLWGLPQDAYSGMTGLSDTMTPGSISELSISDAIAFRVKFHGNPPPRNRRYWRGPVLSEFDGKTWRTGFPQLRREGSLQVDGQPVDYEVTLEPHNRNWLFALEMPVRIPQNARMTADYLVISLPPVRTRMRYEMRSYPDYKAADAESGNAAVARRLPRGFNPRALGLAREWRESLGDESAIVRRGIEFFRASRFEYTLQPPLLGKDSVDEFLFDTRQGFCEHFASSFVFLMRAAGVPARVVTGYQGGDTNPVDNYMVVRQADAHAWAEVWLRESGWTRVDPTAASVPVRVESGIAAAARGAAGLPLLLRTNIDWLRSLRNNWEALTNQWNQWVLGYNPDRQREMLGWLGMQQPSWQTMTMMLFWSVAGVLLLVALWLLRGVRRVDAVQRAWQRFCDKLAGAGLARASAEGPLAYASRLAEQLPARRAAVRSIVDLYVDLRYGTLGDRASVSRLRQLVREFRP
jgi:transglutaminase-like putative cysteine protease